MAGHYTDEKGVLIVLALLKEHGIKKVIASPGATNVTLVASMQSDPHFEMYSCVDERSAAYMACGMAAESGEPVVISCTGATASRNYLPGLTEAFYRKLPVLAITSTQVVSRTGHHVAQVIDRSSIQNDVARVSVTLPLVKDDEDLWECEIKVNKAILELTRHGGGPAHINLPTSYSQSFNTRDLPHARVIDRVTPEGEFPTLPSGRVAVFVGAHAAMSKADTEVIDAFCASNNALVFCDHTSGYRGEYRVHYALVAAQNALVLSDHKPDILIHIGEISGDYYGMRLRGKQVWRVSLDGEIRDPFSGLRYVFEMSEKAFFKHYATGDGKANVNYFRHCKDKLEELYGKMPELPFSNLWIASRAAHRIPDGSVIHFGILNSLRSWNFFELPQSVESASNVGGFGIDGCVSALIGGSLANKRKLHFGIIGDLAAFYDLNAMGNRHVGSNVRILLVNNGRGTEFRQYNHLAAIHGDAADEYIAAARHFGNKSKLLVKHYAEDLGYEYLCASGKEAFEVALERFLAEEVTAQPMLFEVFTDSEDESNALEAIMSIETKLSSGFRKLGKRALGKKGVNIVKRALMR